MTRKGFLVLVTAAALAGCSRPTPEQQIVNDAAQAMGGAERIGAVKTLVIEGGGTQHNIGQDLVPGASGQTFTVTGYTRAVDVQGGRARTELTRQPNFTFFQGPAAQTQIAGLDGAVGYNVAPNGSATRVPDLTAADRRTEFLHHPLTAVRAALDPMARLANPRTEGAESLVDVTTASGQSFTLAIDSTTKLPSRVATTADHTNLGDVVISTTFAGYQATGGLQLPTDLTTRTDDFITQQITVSTQAVDGDTGDLAAPAAAASAPAVSGPPPVTVAEEVLAQGIWHLAGGSHHSVLVEFSDHLMLIETPLNDARALEVIGRARELVPGKPLTQLVNSHHHFDHTGGVRAATSEGLTVITHQGNVGFLEEMAKRPHTIVPDALAKNARPLMVEGVSEERTITDGTMTVNLYPVTSAHSQTMLIAHFPKQRILVEADVYTPGAAVPVYAADFMAQLKPRNLRIDRIAPLHGKVVPYAQFVTDASGPPPAATN